MRTLLLLLAIGCSGCCWMAKRTCFPECPAPKVVKVEKPCLLPGPLKLPAVTRTPCPASQAEPLACYDKLNSGRLARREADLKDWIRQARLRCSDKSTPPSPEGLTGSE
jgi:hypothetical protein